MAPSPPRLAQTFLRWSLPPDDFEVISGDLEETLGTMATSGSSAARLWYWRQVSSIVCSRVRAATFGSDDPQPTRVMMAFRQDLAYALHRQSQFTCDLGVAGGAVRVGGPEHRLQGVVRSTILRGEVVDGKRPRGQLLARHAA